MAQPKSAPRSRQRKGKPRKLTSFNPRTGETLAQIDATAPAEVVELVAHARKVAPEWGAIPPEGRARMLREVRYKIYARMDDLIETISLETGKPRLEALALDVEPTILMLLYFERRVTKALAPENVGAAWGLLLGSSSRVEWRPYGVVGCITPWNYPLTNCFLAIAPALFAGNAVVVKPSEAVPQTNELIREVLDPLPPGVVTVVQGAGDVGAALVDAPCDKICLIGSPVTGRKILAAAAEHLTPCVMELGGKDAAVVLDDADLDLASSGLLWGAFFNAGQTCCSVERAIVVDAVADRFEQELLAKLRHVGQGEGDAEMGSLSFKPQLEVVSRHVQDALDKGATVLAGGPGAGKDNAAGSLWYAPTVLSGVTEEMDVFSQETFGPVLPIVRVRDEDEAVRRANEDGANLTASVWTHDRARGRRVMARLKAGTVGLNEHGAAAGAAWGAWGGVGGSGFGRLNGELGLKEFSVPVHVTANRLPGMKKLWWYPYDKPTEETLRAVATMLGAPGAGDKVKAAATALRSVGKALRNKL
ncbi:MAG: aldehyde dehydrogenase family protein [Actinomycetota bacterium]